MAVEQGYETATVVPTAEEPLFELRPDWRDEGQTEHTPAPLAWRLPDEERKILLTDGPVAIKEHILRTYMSDPSLDYCEFASSTRSLNPAEFEADLQVPERKQAWIETITDYAKQSKEVDDRFGAICKLGEVSTQLVSGMNKLGLTERQERVEQLSELVRRAAVSSEAYIFIRRRIDDQYDKFLKLRPDDQVDFLRVMEKDYYAYKNSQPTVAQTSESQAIEPQPSPTTTIDLESLPSPKISKDVIKKGAKAANAALGEIVQKLKQADITEHVKDQYKDPRKAATWLAVGVLVSAKGDSTSVERPATKALVELADDASQSQWGDTPEKFEAAVIGLPEGAKDTAAAAIYMDVMKSKDTELIKQAMHAVKVNPVIVAARKDIESQQLIKGGEYEHLIKTSISYMQSLIKLADQKGELQDLAKRRDDGSDKILDRIGMFTEFGLKRVKDRNITISPELLSKAAEQFSYAIMAALHPDAALKVWQNEEFESEMEDSVSQQLRETLFGGGNNTYSAEHKELITNFLARAVALTTQDEHKEIQESIRDTKRASTNIERFGRVAGKKTVKLKTFHGRYLPKGDDLDDQTYRFFVKNFIKQDKFKPRNAHTAALGAVGSFSVESATWSCINCWGGGGGNYYGLGQWSRDHRFRDLQNYADRTNGNYRRFNTQIKFAHHELRTSYKTAYEMLKSGKYSASDKAMIWGRHFEIAVDPDGSLQMEAERRARARAYGRRVLAMRRNKIMEIRRQREHGRSGRESWKAYVKDLGMHDTYRKGQKTRQRLYAIKGLDSGGSESNPSSPYYVNGAAGMAIFSADVAPNMVMLDRAADKAGIDLNLISSWRSNTHQTALAGRNSNRSEVATPGYSGHQNGRSADFVLDGYNTYSASSFGTKNGLAPSLTNPRIAPRSHTWRWLKRNGHKFGLSQYFYEPWHQDITPMSIDRLVKNMRTFTPPGRNRR